MVKSFVMHGKTQKDKVGSLDVVTLIHPEGGQVQVSLFGAHVVSWIGPSGEPRLFLSSKADLTGAKPIRGGVPLIFPQFGPRALPGEKALPSHGFARTEMWTVVKSKTSKGGVSSVTLRLKSSPRLEALYSGIFTAEVTVSLSKTLTISLLVKNDGENPMVFQTALHTYFEVPSKDDVSIVGMEGSEFLDNLKNLTAAVETRRKVDVLAPTDRVYIDVPSTIQILSKDIPLFTLESSGFPDLVVWNPGEVRAKEIKDLGEGEFQRMVCVESAIVGTPVKLLAGESKSSSLTITPRDLE